MYSPEKVEADPPSGVETAAEAMMSDEDLTDAYMDAMDALDGGGASEEHGLSNDTVRRLGERVTGRLLEKIGMPIELGDVEMVNPGMAADDPDRWIVGRGGERLRVADYIVSLREKRQGAMIRDALLDVVDHPLGDPAVEQFAADAYTAILGYADPEDQRVQRFRISLNE